VAKLADHQLVALGNADVHTLDPVAANADAASFDEVQTCFSMYVQGKYLLLLIVWRMSPKEALQVINAEFVRQNEQDACAPN
jgi:hypothetical protein